MADSEPGWTSGAACLMHAIGFIRATRASWPLALAPLAACWLLAAIAIASAFHYGSPLLAAMLPTPSSEWAAFVIGALRWLGSALLAFIGCVLAVFCAPALTAPALEHLVRLREHALGLPERAAVGFWRELRCALQSQALAAAGALAGGTLLWFVSALFPVISPLTLALQLLLFACLWAWSLLDYPLSLRGVAIADRLTLFRRFPTAVLGFGAALTLLFAVPGLGLVLLPIAVVAAAELSARLEHA